MPAQRVLLVVAGFFCVKAVVSPSLQKEEKSLKKVPKRGQTPNLLRLVVAVDGKEDNI